MYEEKRGHELTKKLKKLKQIPDDRWTVKDWQYRSWDRRDVGALSKIWRRKKEDLTGMLLNVWSQEEEKKGHELIKKFKKLKPIPDDKWTVKEYDWQHRPWERRDDGALTKNMEMKKGRLDTHVA